MELLVGALYFILGTFVGSFLNVISLRYGTGRGILGRSSCPSCRKKLLWYELVPILSFVASGGTCRSCSSTISWQYPLVELFTGLIFLLIFLKFEASITTFHLLSSTFYLFIFSLLIVIFVYDTKHKIIPDGFVYSFIALAIVGLFVDFSFPLHILTPPLLDILAGPIIFLPLFLLWFFSRGKWMGFGDVKLALGIGWLLGLSGGLSALILAFWVGALVGVFLVLLSQIVQLISGKGGSTQRLFLVGKGLTMKSEIPFAPFLIIGVVLVFFFNINVIELLV